MIYSDNKMVTGKKVKVTPWSKGERSGGRGATPLKKILLPMDFSKVSLRALPYARSLAATWGASVTLVHVVPTLIGGRFLPNLQFQSVARKHLEKIASHAGFKPHQVDVKVLEGSPSGEICKLARKLKVDLIVTTTHGHTGWRQALLGSTAEKVVRNAPCPVMTIRGAGKRLGSKESQFPSRILVATDFSQPSNKAMEHAIAFAERSNSKISVVHVVEPPMYPSAGFPDLKTQERKMLLSAAEEMELWRTKWRGHMRLIDTIHIRSGSASQEVVREALKKQVDLLLIGTHGYKGLKHLILGSTAENIVRCSNFPVLVVHSHERDFVKV